MVHEEISTLRELEKAGISETLLDLARRLFKNTPPVRTFTLHFLTMFKGDFTKALQLLDVSTSSNLLTQDILISIIEKCVANGQANTAWRALQTCELEIQNVVLGNLLGTEADLKKLLKIQ